MHQREQIQKTIQDAYHIGVGRAYTQFKRGLMTQEEFEKKEEGLSWAKQTAIAKLTELEQAMNGLMEHVKK